MRPNVILTAIVICVGVFLLGLICAGASFGLAALGGQL